MARKYKPKKHENIGHRQGDEITITIDDPEFVPCGATARKDAKGIVNSKGNPIALLYSKGHIDCYQKMAADKFVEYWDKVNVGHGLGLDYSRTKVDGGNYSYGVKQSDFEAVHKLKDIKNKLGERGFLLLEDVIGRGIAISIKYPERKDREAKSYQLYECLDVLAVFLGYKIIDYAKTQNEPSNEKKHNYGKIHPFNA